MRFLLLIIFFLLVSMANQPALAKKANAGDECFRIYGSPQYVEQRKRMLIPEKSAIPQWVDAYCKITLQRSIRPVKSVKIGPRREFEIPTPVYVPETVIDPTTGESVVASYDAEGNPLEPVNPCDKVAAELEKELEDKNIKQRKNRNRDHCFW